MDPRKRVEIEKALVSLGFRQWADLESSKVTNTGFIKIVESSGNLLFSVIDTYLLFKNLHFIFITASRRQRRLF